MLEVEKPDRVYFLGAGASNAIYPHLPLATDLTLRRLAEYDDANYRERAATPLEQVRCLLAGSLRGMDSERIEEVLSKQELSGPARTSIVQCILYRLSLENRLSLEKRVVCRLLQAWLTQLRSKGHAIVTTNYDTVCERNLQRLHDPSLVVRSGLEWLDYGISDGLCVKKQGGRTLWRKCESDKCLLLLKLHGSVGWSRCDSSCGRYMLSPIALFAAAQAAGETYPPGAKCPDCGGDPRPVLVPPVKNKQYDDQALQQVWNRATQILRSAREIVFAGYSLSPTDTMVETMLRDSRDSGKTQKVFVVDKNATVAKGFRKIYGDLVSESGTDWRGYLKKEVDADSRWNRD